MLQSILAKYPKVARLVNRNLQHWGEHRVREDVLEDLAEENLLLTSNSSGDNSDSSSTGSKVFWVHGILGDESLLREHAEIVTLGIPREPVDFAQHAVKAGHPKNTFADERDGLFAIVNDNLLLSADKPGDAEALQDCN